MRKLLAFAAAVVLIPASALAQAPTYSPGQTGVVGSVVSAVDPNGNTKKVVLPQVQSTPNYPASGVSAVSSTITSASASSSFTPLAGRTFHVQLSGTASASCYLERQLDGSTWVPITTTAGGTTTVLYNWAYTGSALSEDVEEAQASVPYRVDCGASLGSFASGSLSVRFSQ